MRMLQNQPVCFGYDCHKPVSPADAVYAAPCGHSDHPSAVWHGICLMAYQEQMERAATEEPVTVLKEAAHLVASILDVPVEELLREMGLDE